MTVGTAVGNPSNTIIKYVSKGKEFTMFTAMNIYCAEFVKWIKSIFSGLRYLEKQKHIQRSLLVKKNIH